MKDPKVINRFVPLIDLPKQGRRSVRRPSRDSRKFRKSRRRRSIHEIRESGIVLQFDVERRLLLIGDRWKPATSRSIMETVMFQYYDKIHPEQDPSEYWTFGEFEKIVSKLRARSRM